VDRQRRVTDALKRSIAEAPSWSLEVTDEPRFCRMRDDIEKAGHSKPPPRAAKKREERKFDEIPPDAIPELLIRYLNDDLDKGEARASNLFAAALSSMPNQLRVAAYFPWLIGQMVRAGKIDSGARDWQRITPLIEIEELRVIKR